MQWLREHASKVDLESKYVAPKAYIPREVYSLYLKSTLKEAAAKASKVDFQMVSDEAIGARMLDNKAVEVISLHPCCNISSVCMHCTGTCLWQITQQSLPSLVEV